MKDHPTTFITHSLSSSDDFTGKVHAFIDDWFAPSDMVSVQTSGSTGTPKIFSIEKKRMQNSAEMTCNFLGLKSGDSALLCLPMEYISGKMMVVRSIVQNLKLYITEPSAAPLKNLNQEIAFCAMTPLQVENSLDKMHLISKLIIGGAAVSESLKQKIFQNLNKNFSANSQQSTAIFETYGMSETLSHIALKQIYPEAQGYFKVFDGIEISTDSRGCLKIIAPQLNPEPLQTNDLVEIENRREFRFLGRIDNVINTGGAKIFPEELEAIVKKEIPNEAVFLGITDEIFGEKLVLIIEGSSSGRELPTFNFAKTFHKPKEIIFVEKIPRLPNGKVDRISLKNLVRKMMKDFTEEISFKTSRSSGAGGQNVNKVETAVTAIWNVASTKFFGEEEKQRILFKLKNRINSENMLQITASEARTQLQNKKIALDRMLEIVEQSLFVPKKRLKTRPSKAKIEKRLGTKRKISEKKQERKFRF